MTESKPRLGIGLIGGGFIGRSHAHAFRAVGGIFDLPVRPELTLMAEADEALAAGMSRSLGFARSTGDWRTLIADPDVDVVAIATPNTLHKPMALAAIAAGKPVYCEKPLASTVTDAKEMVDAAEAAGAVTMVGFNYLKNPMVALARELVESGEIGEVIGFRGIHAEDYMADPQAPFTWRLDPRGGHGAIADLGSHIVSIARYVVGPIRSVSGMVRTVVGERSEPGASTRRKVEVDDLGRALVEFASGATGTLEANWVSLGRKMTLAFEVIGSRGTLFVDHERMNELQLYTAGSASGREGFKTILAGPAHAHYREFCPAPGHQLGFNDIKTIEVRALVDALTGGPKAWPDFREAWEIQRVVEAIVRSSRERRWVEPSEL